MDFQMDKDHMRQIFTIPNILTTFRIVLIPFIMFAYMGAHDRVWTVILLVLSLATDIADGYIARHYNQISVLGKALDPFADKLTQAAFMLCLLSEFPHMIWALILIAVKEITSAAFGVIIARVEGVLEGADWYGKLTTGVILLMFFVHFIWADIPSNVSDIMILVSCVLMVISYVLYTARYIRILKKAKAAKAMQASKAQEQTEETDGE